MMILSRRVSGFKHKPLPLYPRTEKQLPILDPSVSQSHQETSPAGMY